ncbi:uncharacterized protein LOC110924623 [Helianthus annuus]|uniref:uncharacterized protein LOC110924623 n=1 Tax=Helianthus annuus TaxID=4232 RepID=UPI000B8F2C16|nr:uncharacterized protein LOC110924623 [Helianthus annuus]
MEQHNANQNDGQGHGRGAHGRGFGGAQIGNPPMHRCTYKTFQGCNPRSFTGAEGPLEITRWIEKMESVMAISGCAADQRVRYASCSFLDEALSWWNSQVQILGEDAAYGLTWNELNEMLLKEYCPRSEIQKIETDFWNLTVEGLNIRAYTSHFNDLARLVPRMVTPEYVKVERYIWGLSPRIRSMEESGKSSGKAKADVKSEWLGRSESKSGDSKKLKSESSRKETDEKRDRKRCLGKAYVASSSSSRRDNARDGRSGSEKKTHEDEQKKCARCGRTGHVTRECYAKSTSEGAKLEGCFQCGEHGHFRRDCPKAKGQNARGRAFELNTGKARDDPTVVTSMFFINNHSAFVLFDTGADFSFVSKNFEPFLCSPTSKLSKKYSIELANGILIETNEVVRGCSIQLDDHSFSIDLLPVELGSFDVVVGMYWLSKNKAEIICSEKQVRIPRPDGGEAIVVHGDRSSQVSSVVSGMKMLKLLRKGYPAFLVNVVDTKAEGRKIEDIPIVRDYPEVFPEDLPGMPPVRQIEFRIDLVPGAAPIAKSPYRLAPSEMKELSNQLQELLDIGFI